MRQKSLDALDAAHQGIAKNVTSCTMCTQWRIPPVEPMMFTQLLELPWRKIVFDLFELNSKHYVVAIDYFSRNIEVMELCSQTAEHEINTLKFIFARHGIHFIYFFGKGLGFSADSFVTFAGNYSFQHDTSSPRYPQSNGEAKKLFRRSRIFCANHLIHI